MARVGQRTWRMDKEKFIEYAEDKLNLMQVLSLTEKEQIELLADGVKDPVLRKLVRGTWATNIPDFLEYVRKVTDDATLYRANTRFEGRNGSSQNVNNNRSGRKTCFLCKKPGHVSKDCRNKITCYKCGKEGHISSACPRKGVGMGATSSNMVEQGEEAAEAGVSTNVATLRINGRNETPTDKACVRVRPLHNKAVSLEALIDTGSHVSLVRESTYRKHYSHKELFKVKNSMKLKGINDSPVKVLGKIFDQIVLDDLPHVWLDIELIVVDDHTMKYDLLGGRKFFLESNLKLTYQNGNYGFEDAVKVNEEINSILAINAIEKCDQYDTIIENLDRDISYADRTALIETIKRAEATEVVKVEDGYCVQIYLKDESLFRYAPRRMSALERKELEDIIDDLLVRKIIKPSISPYCSRVVLVPKRDGKKRMCVDLRPLNQRIFKQKYPFPIVEDQLDSLYGKSVFTKLDMKDGFHQIAIHPSCTKYFAFATPSGQYEYVKLPFGLSEAPAAFQKRIIDIFKDLIRAGKVLVYIDDLLIATQTVKENLENLYEILIRLKSYELKLNLSKCLFLKREIEYLGYLVSKRGISLSQRHVEAILGYLKPQNIKELRRFLGLSNYFRRFIENYAHKTKPLQALFKKNVSFYFDEECTKAFKSLKRELASPPVLCIYNPIAETELHTDASGNGFGAILMQ